MPVHAHSILYNTTGVTGAIWGGGTTTAGNYGYGLKGDGSLAGTDVAGGSVSLDVTNYGYTVLYYIVGVNTV